MMRTLALRFDVDSVTCIKRGIPSLRRLADRLGVRFTFFVNMGYSFNWTHNLRHFLGKRRRGATGDQGRPVAAAPRSLPTTEKLGWGGILETVALNPRLGERYRSTFDALHADGHELGLHGGMDHVVWQRSLDDLGPERLERLLQPAYDTFESRYGRPAGFASPGFRFNVSVLDLLDSKGFTYASDMSGETPFRPLSTNGQPYDHYQVPVNVMGQDNVPMIEQGLARSRPEHEIEQSVVAAIVEREFALMYGHPYVEGVHAGLLGRALERVTDEYDILTMSEYLARWKAHDA